MLQPQPAKVLELLARRSGEVVSREEIREAVWGESFVDFDASLNFCIKQIRRALGDSATAPTYIETLPRRGYRFLQPVQTRAGTNGTGISLPAVAPEEAAPAPPPSRPAPRWPLRAGISAAALALAALVFLIASRFPLSPEHSRLAVFPLACHADPQICGGITEELTAELTRQLPREVEVIGSTSTLAYQGSGKSEREIGGELGAAYLLTGNADASGGHLRIDARLATADGKALWHREGPATEPAELPFVYGEIVRGVAGALRLPLPAAARAAVKPRPEAHEAYLRGIYLLRQRNYDDAVAPLQEAALLDDRFAPAFAALARARVGREIAPQEDRPASEAAARKALMLDPELADAHLALGDVLFQDRVDWKQAGVEYRRAVALAPGDAETHYTYANYLVALGRIDEAITAVERARELDPASMVINSDYAWFLYLGRRYDEAMRQAHDTLKLVDLTQKSFPGLVQYGRQWAYWVLIYGSWKKGDEAMTLHYIQERARAFGQSIPTENAQSLQTVVDRRIQYLEEKARKGEAVSFLSLAALSSVGGHPGKALDALEQECRKGADEHLFSYTAVEPVFDSLHGDLRFLRIVECTGIPRDAPAYLAIQKEQRR
jgi:DNA-binding winged helix-turn-helix (wHTH) protein/TolB-like protein/Tfp pilus assembly protein PilF